MTARRSEHPAVDVLRVLAVSRSSGALEIRGARSGIVFLHEGEITYAEVLGTPPVQESGTDDPQLPSVIHSAVVEAGLTLLTGPEVDGERPLFRPGRHHWTGLTCRVEVEYLLAEINDRLTAFSRLGVQPDEELQLGALPRGRGVVLTPQQWALAVEISGPQTARSLARRTGSPLAHIIGTLAALKGAGVVQPAPVIARRPTVTVPPVVPVEPASASPPARSTAPAPLPPRNTQPVARMVPGGPEIVPAPVSPMPPRTPKAVPPALNPITAAPVRPVGHPAPVTLPHRVAGSTALPPGSTVLPPGSTALPPGSAARRRVPPMPESAPDSRQAIALRLLEGLRRL